MVLLPAPLVSATMRNYHSFRGRKKKDDKNHTSDCSRPIFLLLRFPMNFFLCVLFFLAPVLTLSFAVFFFYKCEFCPRPFHVRILSCRALVFLCVCCVLFE